MTPSADSPRLSAAFWRLTGATGLNTVGQGAFTSAVPLLAATITSDPRLVSIVLAAVHLPWLLLSLPAGVVVDRSDHASLIWRSQALQALVVGIIAVLVALDRPNVTTLVVLAFGLGACQVLIGNGVQTILPDMVAKPLLHAANGYQQPITIIGQQFVGPPIGSLLFVVSMALPFVMDCAAFAISAALMATLPRAGKPRDTQSRLFTAIMDGLHWLARHRLLRTLAVLLGVNTFCFHLGNSILVLLATQTLGLNPGGYGLLLAAAAVGGVLGGLTISRIVDKLGARATLFVALGSNIVAFLGIGLSPNAIVLGTLLALNSFATTLWNMVTVSLRQEIVPSHLLGRVNSVYRLVGWGLIPLGALTGGFLAHTFGLRAPFPIAAVLRAIALLMAAPVLIRAMRS